MIHLYHVEFKLANVNSNGKQFQDPKKFQKIFTNFEIIVACDQCKGKKFIYFHGWFLQWYWTGVSLDNLCILSEKFPKINGLICGTFVQYTFELGWCYRRGHMFKLTDERLCDNTFDWDHLEWMMSVWLARYTHKPLVYPFFFGIRDFLFRSIAQISHS